MNFLSFIQNMQPIAVTETAKAATTRGAKQTTPPGMAIRLFSNGEVYPSDELRTIFALDYQPKNSETVGNGFDIFEARNLPNYPADAPNGLLIGAVAKNAGKVDLFGSTVYDAEGAPKASVMSQGSSTFGKNNLIPMLATVLNQESSEIFKDSSFVDIQVMIEHKLPTNQDFLYIPKTVKTGKDAGQLELVRRTNYSLYPFVYLTAEVQTELQTESAPQVELESPEASHTEEMSEVTPLTVVE